MSKGTKASEVSIREVAALVGVSTATVSNALRGKENVSSATVARVMEAVEELGYVPNVAARQLRLGRSGVVGVAVMNITNLFFSEMVLGIEEVAEGNNYSVIVGNSYNLADRETGYLNLFLRHRYDGVLLAPTLDILPELDFFRRRKVPVVLIDYVDTTGTHLSVTVDDVRGGRLAAEHLLAGGARHIGFVGDTGRLTQLRNRCEGCRQAVAQAGVRFSEISTPPLTMRSGREVGLRIAAMPDRPDAIFVGNDEGALGIMQSFLAAGVSIPDDIAIVGYDDIDFASVATVPLTSMHQPSHEMGMAAADLLFRSIAGDQGLQSVIFEPTLVQRKSTYSVS